MGDDPVDRGSSGEVLDALLADAGVQEIPDARRALIVHAIGFAAFAGSDVLPADLPVTALTKSLRWLLAGMTKAPTHRGEGLRDGA